MTSFSPKLPTYILQSYFKICLFGHVSIFGNVISFFYIFLTEIYHKLIGLDTITAIILVLQDVEDGKDYGNVPGLWKMTWTRSWSRTASWEHHWEEQIKDHRYCCLSCCFVDFMLRGLSETKINFDISKFNLKLLFSVQFKAYFIFVEFRLDLINKNLF